MFHILPPREVIFDRDHPIKINKQQITVSKAQLDQRYSPSFIRKRNKHPRSEPGVTSLQY